MYAQLKTTIIKIYFLHIESSTPFTPSTYSLQDQREKQLNLSVSATRPCGLRVLVTDRPMK